MSPPPDLDFVISAYDPDTFEALVDLWVASWKATVPDIDFDARRPWFLGHLELMRSEGVHVLVASPKAGGPLAGFVTIAPATGYLDQLAVSPAFWGRGAAEALMAAARARSASRIVLDVNQDNVRAVAFYRRLGFVITSEGQNPVSKRAVWRMEWHGDRSDATPA